MRYEYQCQTCAHVFILERKVDDRNDKAFCPKCQHIAAKLLSEPYIAFKGDGFTVSGR